MSFNSVQHREKSVVPWWIHTILKHADCLKSKPVAQTGKSYNNGKCISCCQRWIISYTLTWYRAGMDIGAGQNKAHTLTTRLWVSFSMDENWFHWNRQVCTKLHQLSVCLHAQEGEGVGRTEKEMSWYRLEELQRRKVSPLVSIWCNLASSAFLVQPLPRH